MDPIYYFEFGYHHPDAWCAVQRDPNFDYESSRVLPVRAPSELSALDWDKRLANWYVAALYRSELDLTYNWPPDNHSFRIENTVPEAWEDVVSQIGAIEVGSYPDFEVVRLAFSD